MEPTSKLALVLFIALAIPAVISIIHWRKDIKDIFNGIYEQDKRND